MSKLTGLRHGYYMFFWIPLFLGFLTGCSPVPWSIDAETGHAHAETEPEHQHEGANGEENLSATLWTETLELFAEYPPLEAGKPQSFLLHLTCVDTGLPLKEGEVAFRAEPDSGGAGIQGVARMERPGLFIIETVFPSGGVWTLHITTGTGTVTVNELDVHGSGEPHEHEAHEETNGTGEIVFSKEQQWMVPVITTETVSGSLLERHALQAVVPITPETQSEAAAPVSGMVGASPSNPFPKIGDTVAVNQVLACITPSAMSGESLSRESNLQDIQALRAELAMRAVEASGDAMAARARAAQLTTALDRAERLYEAKAGAQRDVDTARAALAEAHAVLSAAEKRAALAQQALTGLSEETVPGTMPGATPVTAPIAGRITKVYLGVGAHADAGQPIFEVVNTDQVIIEAQAPELLASKLAQPPSGMFEIPGTPGVLYPLIPVEGEAPPWMLPYVDAERRTIPVVLPTRNTDGLLRLGMTLTFWADSRTSINTLKIPLSAVSDENGVSTAYVMRDGECFQKRPVRLGINDGQWTEVLDGLKAGERVVSQGVYAVRLAGTASGGLGSAHVH